jgi:hypothetical protein
MRVQFERMNSMMTKLILGSRGADLVLGAYAQETVLLFLLEEGTELVLRQRIVGVRKEHWGELRREEKVVLWS